MKKPVVIMLAFAFWTGFVAAQNLNRASLKDNFFQTHKFVFFFASTCQYCHQFSPVLSHVANILEVEVLPLSFDNQPLPEFPDALPATADWTTVAFENESIHYPALFIANPEMGALYPVSIGALNEAELIARIDALVPQILAYESRGVKA